MGRWARPLEAVRALQGVFSALLVLVSFLPARVSCALVVLARRPSLVEEVLSSSLAEALVEGVVRRPSLVVEGVVLTSRP